MTALLVAATGGHLRQLHELRPRIPGAEDAVWFTFDTPQSRSLLAGEDVVYGTYAGPRAVVANVHNARRAHELLQQRSFDLAVSTGASVAVAVLPQAAQRRIPCHYIESATRVSGPSLTGRMLRPVPGIRLYAQYRSWALGPWSYGGSIFEGFRAVPRPDGQVRRILVTLGTIEGYGFRRLIERVLAIAPPDAEIIWQTGTTDVSGLPIEAHREMPSAELDALLSQIDVVISHAGTGSSIASLAAGRTPILVPRRADRGEHVDDHQLEIAEELDRLGLARHVEVDDLGPEHLEWAASHRAVIDEAPPAFRLLG
jgi:UDP-N-acetylglucosamine--N-acetylmuramyl-(pentapeptide) pyrophosphoryl-undecaprenol N-acetylglucosamine transferase